MKVKRSLIVGAAVATATLGALAGAGVVSAATDNTKSETSIVDKLASKFNLNKDEVQAVFDEDRAAHRAEREADQKERLAQAVSDGKLTQAQADHVTAALNDIRELRGDAKPRTLSDEARDRIKDKMDALRDWAKQNNIDLEYVMPGHIPGGHGGPGWGMRGER
ncbi:MAG TPA: hypothetical protein VGE30_03360 [Candidatus Saccharimonadales bacterium]